MVPFPVNLSDPIDLDFKVMGNYTYIDAFDVLCAQLRRDLFAIAKFLSSNNLNRQEAPMINVIEK